MKKRVALAVGAVLVMAGLGACWHTGTVFERAIAEQIARVQRESGAELTWLPASQGLFSRDGVLKLVVAPQAMATIGDQLAEHEPFEARFMVSNRILPLHIKTRMSLDTSKGTLAPLFASLGMTQWQLGVESVSNLWLQRNHSRFWANEFRIAQGLDEFSFLPMEGSYQGDLDGNGQVSLGWQGMTLHEERSDMDLVLANIKGSADMAEIGGAWLSPHSEMSLDAFSMQLPEGGKIFLQGMSTISQLAGDDDQTLSNRYQMKVAHLNLEDEGDSLALIQSNLALNLKGLDLAGYRELQAVSGQDDDAPLVQALDKLLGRGATLELVDLSARLNGEPVSLRGEIRLAPTSLARLSDEGEGIHALSGLLHADLGGKLSEAVPQLAPILAHYVTKGLLKAEQDRLTAEVKLDKGAMTINGLSGAMLQ